MNTELSPPNKSSKLTQVAGINIEIKNLNISFKVKNEERTILSDLNLNIKAGEMVSITGKSGCGKSSLLYSIGGLRKPKKGEILIEGKELYNLTTKKRKMFLKEEIGFIFQQFHLLPYLNVVENIRLCALTVEHSRRIPDLITQCGLIDVQKSYPHQLSVGEKQRVAFIRAVICDPKLILADEPTGNLDEENTATIYKLLAEYNQKGATVIIVTHDNDKAQKMPRVLEIKNGRI